MLSIDFDFSQLAKQLDGITNAAEAAVRPAAQEGAQVFYEEVRARVPVSKKPHKSGKQTYQPGHLRAAIYQFFLAEESKDGSATYVISWRKKAAFYARFLEFGTSKMAARPFLRPAYDAAQRRALLAVQRRLHVELQKARKS